MSPPDDESVDQHGDLSADQNGDQPATRAESVDSRWWYWVAAVPLYYVFASVVGFLAGLTAFVVALTGSSGTMMDGTWHVGPEMTTGMMLGGSLFVLAILGLALLGMVLTLLFPVAIYFDAEAVERVGPRPTDGESGGTPRDGDAVDWQPDPALYGLLGIVGIVAQPLQAALAVYYLYKRHEFQGQP
jgi:hypothetical protein